MITNEELARLLSDRKQIKTTVSATEWQARVELAACYRLIAHFKWTDWIYNHISLRVPGSHDHYFINPFGLLYEEITASSLIKVDVNGNLVEDVNLAVNPAAFVIHGAIHKARPEISCVLHTHSAAGVGVAAQKGGLLPISQHAFKVYDRTAYHEFEGIALDLEEQARLVSDIGVKDVLILKNHGLLTMGKSVEEAFSLMFFLERACQIQIAALAGNGEILIPAADVIRRTCEQFSRDSSYVQGKDWQALIRLLDKIQPDYKN